MLVTFKAEIMPGRSREQRTFRIKQVLSNGRIILYDFIGEHRQAAFEPINFLREKAAKFTRNKVADRHHFNTFGSLTSQSPDHLFAIPRLDIDNKYRTFG